MEDDVVLCLEHNVMKTKHTYSRQPQQIFLVLSTHGTYFGLADHLQALHTHFIWSFKFHILNVSRQSVGPKHLASVEGINKNVLWLMAEGMSIFRMEV